MSDQRIAVIYARYSSHQQRDVSIEQQVNACKKYAQANDLDVIRVYDDHAMTGTNDNRPAFKQMIKDSASGAFQYVIVYTLDRFSRDRYDSAIHKHTLKEHGVKVLSAMENLQDNPVGVLMESILEGFAEYYSKELAQKLMRGTRASAEKCLVVGGVIPYGYRAGNDRHYEIHPDEAPIVKEIFERIDNGERLSALTEDFNRRHLRTRTGSEWNKNSFSRILSNERYTGIYIFSDIRIEGGMPKIIDRDLFDRVQHYIRTKPNARGTQRRRRLNGTYLLTGKLYCGMCKSPMVGVSGTGKHGELHFYYACKNRLRHVCKKKNISRDLIERLIAEKLQSLIFTEDAADAIADELIKYLKENEETDEMRTFKDRIAQLEKERSNTLNAIRMGVITASVQQMLTDIETELDTLKAKFSIAQERARTTLTKEDILSVFDLLRTGDINDKAYQERLIDAFLIRAYLYDDRIKIVFSYSAGSSNETDIPFDIDEIEDDAGTFESSYNDSNASPLNAYTNTLTWRFIKGMFVAVTVIGQKEGLR